MDIRSLKNVFKLLSLIGLALSVFFIIPIVTGMIYHEDYRAFLIFDGLFFLTNLLLHLALIDHEVELSLKQGILSVNAVWVLLGIAGSVPLLLYSDITITQAIFESVSGFTTTGATIYEHIETLPKMLLILRSLMEWLGGIGIIVLGVGLFSLINPSGSLTLFKAESTGIKMDKMTPKIKDTAIRIWGIYLLLTIIDGLLLKVEGMSTFDAINHAFTTIATGGFSTRDSSMGHFANPWILWTTTFFMLLSGINYLAHLKLFYGDTTGYRSEEVRWFLVIYLLLSLSLSLEHMLNSGDGVITSMTHAFFNLASILTTTGYASLDYEQWGQSAVALIFIAMLIGGNAGSTSGGMKVIRYIVVTKAVFSEIKRILHPSAVINVFVDKTLLQHKVIASTFVFITLFTSSVVFVAVYLYMRGFDPTTSLGTALASVGNIGPGLGLSGPAQNYSFFSGIDLIVLSLAMIAGRLEFLTILLLFSRNLWKKF